ncbi:MAG TPA: hypothetical protein VGN12_27150 [Pirellulales bacterium]
MTNRISHYCGDVSDVALARDTLAFCDAVLRSRDPLVDLRPWEIDALSELHGEAVGIFRIFAVPLPWERASSR